MFSTTVIEQAGLEKIKCACFELDFRNQFMLNGTKNDVI